MDALEQSDLQLDRSTSPEQKLLQTLDLMAAGLRLQKARLAQQNPDFDEGALEQAFQAWLFAEDDG